MIYFAENYYSSRMKLHPRVVQFHSAGRFTFNLHSGGHACKESFISAEVITPPGGVITSADGFTLNLHSGGCVQKKHAITTGAHWQHGSRHVFQAIYVGPIILEVRTLTPVA